MEPDALRTKLAGELFALNVDKDMSMMILLDHLLESRPIYVGLGLYLEIFLDVVRYFGDGSLLPRTITDTNEATQSDNPASTRNTSDPPDGSIREYLNKLPQSIQSVPILYRACESVGLGATRRGCYVNFRFLAVDAETFPRAP
jgi:hypothetical protein